MANTFKVLFRGAATTDSATLYTVPAGATTLVTSIVVTNAGSDDATYTIWLGGVLLANDVSVPANDSVILEVKQVMVSDTAIDALSSSTAVKWHISGLEIT